MRRCFAIVVALAVLLAVSSMPAPADTYPKNPDVDVLHYVFDVTLSDSTDRIVGETTVQVRFLKDGTAGFALDLVGVAEPGAATGMTVTGVDELVAAEAGGIGLSFNHDANRLRITLGPASRAGEVRRFRIRYAGTPATGLIIGNNKYGDRTFFSDNWPNKARNWLPLIDHPYEKATAEMIVTAPENYQVVSNGLLVEEIDLAGDELSAAHAAAGMPHAAFRRTHWRQSVPIAPWLFSLGAARFAVDHYAEVDGVPLQTWVYAQDRDAGFYDFSGPTEDVVRFFSDAIGPYAYEKLANVQSNSVGGGMEAATSIFYGDDSVTGDRGVRWRNVIIHEIAHQWWGNAVTEVDWDHVWLSEGFATYFTLLYREYAHGHDDFLAGLADARRRVVDFYADNPDYRVVHDNLDDMSQVTNGMTYQKGAWVLHMLRGMMGEERFWRGIRDYYRLYRNGSASTDDFREAMENAFDPAIDLSGFFRQWLYQGGFPNLRGTWRWDTAAGELVVELEQIEDDGYTFEMPIPIAITVPAGGGGGARAGRGGRGGRGGGDATGARGGRGGQQGPPPQALRDHVMMQPGTSVTRIRLDAEPLDVVLDPDHWVLMEATLTHERR